MLDVSGVGDRPPGDQIEEGRFARSVRPDDAQALALGQLVGEGGHHDAAAVGLGRAPELQHLAAETPLAGLEGLLDLRVGLWSPGDHLADPVLPLLVLPRPGLGAALEPLQLGAEDRLPALLVALRLGLPLGFPAQVVRVAALVLPNPAPVDLHDRAADGVQEPAVVGNQDEGPGGGSEFPLQPFDGVQVQVVGRLVQEGEFRLGGQAARQGRLLHHAARKGVHPEGQVSDAELREERSEAPLQLVAAPDLHVVGEAGQLGLGRPRGGCAGSVESLQASLVAANQAYDRVVAPEEEIPDRITLLPGGDLVQDVDH